MKYFITLSLFFCFIVNSNAQTDNQNLNDHLHQMKKYFLAENYPEFCKYVYPAVYETTGGKEKLIQTIKLSVQKMGNDNFSFIDIKYKNPSEIIEYKGELQTTIIQELIMQTPKGKIQGDYTMVCISQDNGKTWTFIDTSGKPKETMQEVFPNLSPDLVFTPKSQQYIE